MQPCLAPRTHSAPLAQHEQKIAQGPQPARPRPCPNEPPHCHHRKRGSKTDWPLADKTALKPDMSDAGTYLDRIRTGKRRSQRRRLQRGTASAAMRMPLWSCFDLQAVWGQRRERARIRPAGDHMGVTHLFLGDQLADDASESRQATSTSIIHHRDVVLDPPGGRWAPW